MVVGSYVVMMGARIAANTMIANMVPADHDTAVLEPKTSEIYSNYSHCLPPLTVLDPGIKYFIEQVHHQIDEHIDDGPRTECVPESWDNHGG